MSTALILSGGGARGAYQVGVLKALSDILPRDTYNPFPIISGTSTGGINALALAGRPGHFRLRMRKLEYIWRSISPDKVYRSDAIGVLKNTIKVMVSFFHSGYPFGCPVALFDNSPLKELLQQTVRFRHIDEAIASGELQALCITCMSYTTGQSVAFFQGSSHHEPWERSRRVGVRTGLTVDHLMASAAIPALFPAKQIGDHYYGDGAIRQLKPLSSALQLGARKLFVVGVSDNPRHKPDMTKPDHPPSIAQIVSHMFNSAFIDSMEADLETLHSINRLVEVFDKEERSDLGIDDMRPIDALLVTPSQPIDVIATEYLNNLPTSLKLFMRAIGATAQGGGASTASFLLFEKEFCTRLLNMGYRDAMEQEKEIRAFFEC
ncbi:patatin-like phospholipase family protein [bacterium SCSIO 12696]|nr:patatin-like phospholipase family protein [bacterium SCSIO 12696]